MRSGSALAEKEPSRSRDGDVLQRPDTPVRVARQRFWPVEQRIEASTERAQPGTTQPEATSRQRGSSGLLYTWRRQIQEAMTDHGAAAGVTEPFVPEPLQIAETPPPSPLQDNLGRPMEQRAASGVIEIDLPNGVCVRVDNHVDPVALRRVLDALQGR